MLFRSKAAAHLSICRPEKADWSMGFKNVVWRQLEADFGQSFGAEQVVEDVSDFGGRSFSTAVIQGGVFDTITAQKANGWTDEERQIVERRLLEEANDQNHRGQVWLYEPPKADPPWPTYDTMHHKTIAPTAASLGLINEAIIYEQRSDNRPGVVAELLEQLEKAEQEQTLVAQ